MATARRVFWETVIFLGFLLALGGILLWSSRRVDSRSTRLVEQHDRAIEARDVEHQAEIEELRDAADQRALLQAEGEAEAVLAAFAAAAHTAIEARWGNYLAAATENLTRSSDVVFVYVLTPSGSPISGSGDANGQAEDGFAGRTAWVLTAESLQKRPGTRAGVLELAAPIEAGGQTAAYLWLGYDLRRAAGAPSARP